ncbi:PREDICTED: protein IDA-LIKE 2-like [Camelina sativa]|uniref:Protein IDA-LIKE 2-like n=1 Tax=Camelina sativa TaxID=90675 RepID=A0ABM0VY47_CAMSA|nr:PREDICTED: protein IDA-LIKE 2-like [Camelina sativa]XP_010484254.1 PREDICTED: protein IDA-LIKE 2-like [Camelina sativa]
MSSRNRRSRVNSKFFFFTRRTILLLLLLLGFCDGARTNTNVFNSKPHNDAVTSSPTQFLGFLPRHFPVPASGPSRKHNDIGLLSWHRSSP